MTVISLSLTPELLERLDTFVKKNAFSSRSEALRIAIRDSLTQYETQTRVKGSVMSTVSVISLTGENRSHIGLMNLRNGFDSMIFGNMHMHTEEGYCIEIFLVKGTAEEVMKFIARAQTVKGVREVKYTLTPYGA